MIAPPNNLSTVVGFVASVISVLLGCIYLAAILTSFLKAGLTFPPSEPVQLAGAIVSIGIGVDLVVLMVALQHHIPEGRQILAEIAVIFTALLCVSTSINRFVQLSILPRYRSSENPEILAAYPPLRSEVDHVRHRKPGMGLILWVGCPLCRAGHPGQWHGVLDQWIIDHRWRAEFAVRRGSYPPAAHLEPAWISSLERFTSGCFRLAGDPVLDYVMNLSGTAWGIQP